MIGDQSGPAILIDCQGVMMGLATCRGRPAVAKSAFLKRVSQIDFDDALPNRP